MRDGGPAEALTRARLTELAAGAGEYRGLAAYPAKGTVTRARRVAAGLFGDGTPPPAVAGSPYGEVLFTWEGPLVDVEIAVGPAYAFMWARDNRTGAEWCDAAGAHLGCCVRRILGVVAAQARTECPTLALPCVHGRA
jgi:hypothetical protein